MKFLARAKKFIFKSRTRVIIFAVIVLGIGFVFSRIISGSKSTTQYQTAQVSRGTLVVSVSASGNVAVANRVSITTQTSGTINDVFVQNGDTVTAGEEIADLTLNSDGQARQAQALSSLLAAQSNLSAAQAKMNSLQSALFKANQTFLNDRGIANPNDQQKADPVYIEENAAWLQAEADYKNQSQVISQAQAAVSAASLAYNETSTVITAPVAGTISDITIAPGLLITNSQSSANNSISSQVVASIKQPGTPIVSVTLSEIDAAKVQAGQRATITLDAFPNKTFTGKVLGIDTTGTISSGVTSYPTTIVLDEEDDSILPNMSASANIVTKVKDTVILVPTAAVQTVGGASTVRVLKNGQIATQTVEIGDSSDTDTEVTSGLSDGDTVVIGALPTSSTSSSGASPFSRNLFGGGGFRAFGGGGGGGGGVGRGGGATGGGR